jgi:nucleotide-binding universal stress UspA family protein
MAFERVLVPVDFSPCSGAALRYAALLQQRFGSKIEVIHACEVPPIVPEDATILMGDVNEGLAVHLERQSREQLEMFLRTYAADCRTTHELRLGPPAATLREKIREGDCDLVVMGTHGRTGFERFMLGSVAERVVRTSHVPVLTIPAGHRAGEGAESAADAPSRALPKTILVGIDYEPASRRALNIALQLAEAAQGRILSVFAWAAPYAPSAMAIGEVANAHHDLFDRVREQAAQTMRQFVEEQGGGTEHGECLIVSGDPRSKLLEMAEQHAADLIVVGTHNRTGIGRFLLGSVAEHLLRHAHCPVLAVPAAESQD